jgi:hypothetical protein
MLADDLFIGRSHLHQSPPRRFPELFRHLFPLSGTVTGVCDRFEPLFFSLIAAPYLPVIPMYSASRQDALPFEIAQF